MTEISTILTNIEKQLKVASNAIVCPTMSDKELKDLHKSLKKVKKLTKQGLEWAEQHGEGPMSANAIIRRAIALTDSRWTKTL